MAFVPGYQVGQTANSWVSLPLGGTRRRGVGDHDLCTWLRGRSNCQLLSLYSSLWYKGRTESLFLLKVQDEEWEIMTFVPSYEAGQTASY
jgi:hypothetical protein